MISDLPNYYEARRKKIKYLICVSISLIIGAGIIVISIFTPMRNHITLIAIIVLTTMLIIVLLLKPKITYYSMMEMYFRLLDQSIDKYRVKETFSLEWLRKLNNMGFNYSYKGDDFEILYRITKPLEKKMNNTNQVLEIVTVIKDEGYPFYSDSLDKEYKKIWIENQGRKQLSKQVILQFKKYGEYNQKKIDELDQIIAYKERKNYLITINCGYFPNEKNNFYFLHSNIFFPNRYYKHGCELVKEIVN